MPSGCPNGQENVTWLLERIRIGDESAGEQLMDLVYSEIRALAGAIVRNNGQMRTLQPTALVHEAWLKLAGNLDHVEGRHHFFALAAKSMRQVLADHAKAGRRLKRGGGCERITLFEHDGATSDAGVDLIEFHEVLQRLSELSERQGRVVELRLLGALTIEETADVLGVSPGTVKTDWSMARSWLQRELLGE